MKTRSEAEIARDTRWKLPSLERFGFNEMTLELEKISESLNDLQYFVDDGDETFMEAMDGDRDEEIEFRAMFSALEAEKETISEMVYGYGYGSARGFVWLMNEKERKAFRGECDDDDDEGPYNACRAYDDCTVALVGRHNNLHTHGFDIYERDVFGLDDFDAERAAEAAKKRLMRMTKKDMVELRGCIHTFEGILRLFIREKLRFLTISQKSGTRRFPSRHAIHGFLRKSRFAQLSPELIAQNGIFL